MKGKERICPKRAFLGGLTENLSGGDTESNTRNALFCFFIANKIKYDGTLQQLYERDHEWYYYYNAVDALLVMLIHYRLKCVESPCAVSSVTYVPLIEAMGQVALTTANVFKQFYMDTMHVVWEYDSITRV